MTRNVHQSFSWHQETNQPFSGVEHNQSPRVGSRTWALLAHLCVGTVAACLHSLVLGQEYFWMLILLCVLKNSVILNKILCLHIFLL